MKIDHPQKICIPVETALADWTGPGCYQQKIDGCFAVREFPDGVVVGENVSGEFTAFDCVKYCGEDVASEPLLIRLGMRDNLCLIHNLRTVRTVWSDGASLLREVLAKGGEGVCIKSPGSYFNSMVCSKRSIIVQCRVSAIGPGQSITLRDFNGEDLGKCPAKGGAADRVRVGSVVRIDAACYTINGKLREPKLCREWLVKF